MRALGAVLVAAAVTLSACAVPSDDDGELVPAGSLAPAAPPLASATPLVVDTDLGADDVVALAYLLREPRVDVRAVTIVGTGLARCRAGADVVSDLLLALAEDAVPIACGREERGPGGTPLPGAWRAAAEAGSGLPRDPWSLPAVADPAVDVLAEQATSTPGLHVVALGPLTNLADLVTADPAAWAAIAGVTVMGGVVEGPGQDEVGEWNVAADPAAFARVLEAADAPRAPRVTVVPADAVPSGTPAALAAPVVGNVVAASPLPAWWDVTAAAVAVDASLARGDTGRYELDAAEPGRLARAGDGATVVVESVDQAGLEAALAETLRYH